MVNVSQTQKIIECIDVRVFDLLYSFVFCFLLEFEENGLPFDETLEMGDLLGAFMDDFALFTGKLVDNCRVLIRAVEIIRKKHGSSSVHLSERCL